MVLLHTALVLATVTILQSTAQDCPHYGEIEQSSSDNIVSICLPEESSTGFRWIKICADNWTLTHARLACRQLNMGYQGITNESVILSGQADTPCVSLPGCRGTENNLTECGDGNSIPRNSTVLARAECKCINGDVRTSTDPTATAVVQFCHQGIWKSICRDSAWNEVEANLVCNQLGYGDTGATASYMCQPPDENGYLRDVRCRNTHTMLRECPNNPRTTCDQDCSGSKKRHSTVQCSSECVDREMRLVGGSTNRGGRVEVCVDGRWGTVCNNHPELQRVVCSQLHYPAEGSVLRTYTPGFSPVYSCNSSNGTGLSCSLTNDVTCDHSRDLGVYCLSQDDLLQVIQNNNLKSNCPETACEKPTCPTITLEPTNIGINNTTNSESGVSSPVLGGVVGVLVTVLVVLVIGGSLSCVALVKRNSHTHKQKLFRTNRNTMETTEHQLDNPVYDSNMETHDYSSSGPAYELADTNEGAGQTYSVLEQCQERAIPLKTGTGVCAYEVPVSGQTNNQVKVCEEEYSTLQH